jgi:hypothetical protein
MRARGFAGVSVSLLGKFKSKGADGGRSTGSRDRKKQSGESATKRRCLSHRSLKVLRLRKRQGCAWL